MTTLDTRLLAFANRIAAKFAYVFNNVAYPEAFGAVGDGVTDDSAAIQSAISSGKRVVFRPQTTYAIASTLNIGNGTSTTLSTLNGVILQGTTSGAAASEFAGGAVRPTCIKWIGASNGTMVNINGPIVGVNVQGIFFDCNNLAATAVYFKHMLASTWQDVVGGRYIGFCYIAEAYPAALGTFVNGSQKVTMTNFRAKNPGTGGSGIRFGVTSGYVNAMLDVAQWTLINSEFYRDGATASTVSAQFSFCDNMTLIETAAWAQGGSLGKCVYMLPPTGSGSNAPKFPAGIAFYNCPLQGGIVEDVSWTPAQKVFCFPYPTGDGEPVPTSGNIIGMDSAGRWFGNPAFALPGSATPTTNGDMSFQLTSDTSLTLKVKGSDGTVRSASLTLS